MEKSRINNMFNMNGIGAILNNLNPDEENNGGN
jgi:hypothetical protein